MTKKYCEKNLVFSNKSVAMNLKKNGAVLKNRATTVLPPEFEEKQIITTEQEENHIAFMKLWFKILIVINIVTNIAFLFFLADVLSGFDFSNGIGFNFTTINVIGLVIFIIAQVSGIFLFVDTFRKQPFRRKFIMASAPLTLIFLGGLWLVLSVDRFDGETENGIVQALNLENFDPSVIDFKYVIIAVVAFLVLLYFLFGWLVRKYSNEVKQMADKKNIK